MGLVANLKWTAFEVAGAGVNRRLFRYFCSNWRTDQKANVRILPLMFALFFASAKTVVDRFGPAWTRKKFGGHPLGVWLFLILWLTPILLVAFSIHGGSSCKSRTAVPRGPGFTVNEHDHLSICPSK